MRRPLRRAGWLGWALAGVLAVAAAGTALAGAGEPVGPGPAAPPASDGVALAAAELLGAGPPALRAARRGAARRLHGEVTVRTRDGFATYAFARGEVTALPAERLSVRSDDGVSTTFTLSGETRYGTWRRPQRREDLEVGDRVLVLGEKAGGELRGRLVVEQRAGAGGP